MKIVIWIPARGNSKRVPNKNIRDFAGKPLLIWAIESAYKTTADEVWVDTENTKIGNIAMKAGAMISWRLKELATDDSMSEDALIHFSKTNDFDAVILLQCTSPMVNEKDLQGMIDTYKSGKFDSVTLLGKSRMFINKLYGEYCFPVDYNPYNIKQSQHYEDKDYTYFETGVYLVSREWLLKTGCRMGGMNGYYIKHNFHIDIDTVEDFIATEGVMKWIKSGQEEMN